ncbi:MAG TPA: FHA domain-containing protein [Candidatus Polarisedimenticolia bacterium]|nr:FHA domain-containing protein [Candidatus Polarisedimenticolia bacterium]
MIVHCTACGKRYNLDPARLAGRREASVRCTSCQAVIKVTLPEVVPAEAPDDGPPAAPAAAASAAPAAPADPLAAAAAAGDRTSRLSADAALLAAPGHVAAGPLEMPAGRRVSLAVLDGPDLGRIFRVEQPSVTIGRGDAEVHLEDGEVSRQHARLEMRAGRAVVRDLGSTNGTFVDDVKVAEAEIENRGEFRVGQTRLMLILADEETS